MSEQNYPSYLIHYGIEGQKWGVRRFQNEDGTYTSEGLERRRSLIEKHGLGSDIRKATRIGKFERKINKQMAKSQNIANKEFDKRTEKILRQREKGQNPSERDIKKAIKAGTSVREWDEIAKDPQRYYKAQKNIRRISFANQMVLGLAGMPLTMAYAAAEASSMKKYYSKAFDRAKQETIADLKKHGVIK